MKSLIFKNKQKVFMSILMVLFFSSGIFISQKLTAQKNNVVAPNPIKLGDVEYLLEIVSITKNKNGKVQVKVNGSEAGKDCKFWQKSVNGEIYNVMPSLGVEIISNGKVVSANRFVIEKDGMLVEFQTKILPSSVIIFNVNNENQKVVFDAKSKKPIKK